jgi:hypothetical protein
VEGSNFISGIIALKLAESPYILARRDFRKVHNENTEAIFMRGWHRCFSLVRLFFLFYWRRSDHEEITNIPCRLQSNINTNIVHVAGDEFFILYLKLIYELTVGKGLENESVVVDVTSKI